MKSYTTGRNLAGVWTKNTNTSNLSYLDQTANDAYRHMCSMKDWSFLEQLRTMSSIASQQFYPAPYDCSQVKELSVTVSTNITYTPKLSPSREHWDQLNLSKFTSDVPEWYFIFGGNSGAGMTIGLWPTPASASNTINVTQKCRVVDLQFADYVTGTITTTVVGVNGYTTVTGSGTGWDTGMVGRWINITPTNAAGGGDGQWYLITGVTNSTTLTLANAYGGVALSGASAAYTMAQMPLLPEDFHDTPWARAAQIYWTKEDDERAAMFEKKYDGDVAQLVRTWSAPGGVYVIDTGDDPQIINPNVVIRL